MSLHAELAQAHRLRHERFFPDPHKPKPKIELPPAVIEVVPLDPAPPLVPPINIPAIMKEVCIRTGVSREQILSETRQQRLVMPRQIVMYLARRMTRNSYPAIGKRLARHHTSVMHGATRIAGLRAISPEMDRVLTELETEILSQEQT